MIKTHVGSDFLNNAAGLAKLRIAASAGTIALATAASRCLGFARDLLIAKLFGTGSQAQAFVVAFRLPNLLRDLVAEGAVTSAIVPVLSAYRATKSPEDFWRLTQALCARITVLVCAMGLAGILLAPWLVRAIAPGFLHDPDKFALTVRLTRLLFPFITLVGLWAYFSGLLNSLGHFALPALGPCVLNLAMIGGCLWLAPLIDPPVLGLIWGVLLGGFAQLVMQLPASISRGFRWRCIWRHAGSREVTMLLAPRLVGAAVHQLSVFLNTVLASLSLLAGEGAVAALYFANRLVQLPLALFGVASAQASLPTLSEQAARRDLEQFASTVLSVLRMVAFVSIPAAAGLMALASPIVRVCFERGAFDRYSSAMTAQTLSLFAIGLLAYATSKVLAAAFYALHDTRTPVTLAVQALAVNIVLAVLLVKPLRVGGLALATAIASSFNAWGLLKNLQRKLDEPLVRGLVRPLARMSLAALIMGISCWAAWEWLGKVLGPLTALPLLIFGGMLLYGACCRIVGVAELSKALEWLARRFRMRLS